MAESKNSVNIQVYGRVRPSGKPEENITILNEESISLHNGKVYKLEKIFSPESEQVEVYNETAKSMIRDVLNGYNATMFAYGQTSSGKTYTMEGDLNNKDKMGIIPRMGYDLFQAINSAGYNCEIKVSYVEIYLEKIRDLLDENKTDLSIYESLDKPPSISGVTEVIVQNVHEFLEQVEKGRCNRAVSETDKNQHSSRSHSILNIFINYENPETKQRLFGKLLLIDLAGSEMVSNSNAHMFNESKYINKSLSTLSQVIYELSIGNKHISYRNSRLTRLLKDSLGGNAKTILMICLSSDNLTQTKSSLEFGSRAKLIKNSVSVNEKNTGNKWKALWEKSKSYFEGVLCENRRWRSGEKVPQDEWVTLLEVDDMNESSLLSTSADCSLLSNLDQSCSFVENRERINSQKLQIEELEKQLQDAKNFVEELKLEISEKLKKLEHDEEMGIAAEIECLRSLNEQIEKRLKQANQCAEQESIKNKLMDREKHDIQLTNELSESLKTMSKEINEKMEEIGSTRSLNEQSKKELKPINQRAEQESIKNKLSEKENLEIQLANDKLSEFLKMLSKERDEKTEEIMSARSLNEQSDRELKQANRRAEQESIKKKHIEREKQEMQLTNDKLSESLKMLSKEMDEKTKEIGNIRSLNEQNDRELKQVNQRAEQESIKKKLVERENHEVQLTNVKLSESLKLLSKEIDEKTEEIGSLRSLNEQKHRELKKANRRAEQESIKIKLIEREKHEIQLTNDKLSESLKMLSKEMDEKTEEIGSLRSLNEQMHRELKQANQRAEQESIKNKLIEIEKIEIKLTNDKFSESLKMLSKEMDEKTEEIWSLRSLNEQNDRELKQAHQREEQESIKNKLMEREKQETQLTIDKLSESLKMLNKEMDEKTEEIWSLRSLNEQNDRELKQANLHREQERIKLKLIEQEKYEIQLTNEKLSESLKLISKEMNAKVAEIESFKSLNEQNERELKQANQRAEQESIKNKLMEREKHEIKVTNDKLSEALKMLSKEMDEKTEEIWSLRSLNEQNDRELKQANLRGEQESIKMKLIEQEKHEIQLTNEKLSEYLKIISEEMDEKVAEIESLKSLNEQNERELVLVKKELNAALEEKYCDLQNIEKCKKSLDEKVNELQLELKEKASNEILLTNKIIDLEKNVSYLNLECSEYIIQMESLSEELKKSNLSVLEKAEELEFLEKENTEIKTKCREELLNVKKQRELIEVNHNIKLNNLLKENEELKNNMEKYISMKKNLEARVDDLSKKIQEVDEKNSELFSEIQHNADEKLKIEENLNLSLSQAQNLKENNLDMSKQIQSFDDKINELQLALKEKTNKEIVLTNKIIDSERKAKYLNEIYRILYPD